ncbi:hypothetical protein [Streptomyces sp. Ncost-T10-10d]|uniref:hypothetical protein n=1 Tax=Streptomyces sp. Ncost-T10-10d TaxID=1839774 RepID=UPI00081ECB21|nr:hypothetical protein [Streptomyces sp. Ncost-T10-10d]SCF59787.1 hypothetical protein GA0115254_106330 [Streptomyces sp. Ncost-T10-10d]
MAWEEWERAKAAVRDRHEARMQLNQAAPGSGAGDGDLVVHQDDLGAVGHEAFILHGELKKKADIAGAGADKSGSGSTMQAAAALKSHNLGLGAELESTVEFWSSQVKHVLQACAHISNHLDYSKKAYAQDDAVIAAELRGRTGPVSVSALNEYFK